MNTVYCNCKSCINFIKEEKDCKEGYLFEEDENRGSRFCYNHKKEAPSCRNCKYARWLMKGKSVDKSYPGRCECIDFALDTPACVRIVSMKDGIYWNRAHEDCKFWERDENY